MLTHTIKRLVAVGVVAVGLLAATAAPASAVPRDLEIQPSSTWRVHSPASAILATYHVVAHPTTNVCAGNSDPLPRIPVEFPSDGTGVIGSVALGYSDFAIGTNTFKTRFVITGGTMTLSATGFTMNLTIRMEFRTCDSQTALCTTNTTNVTLSGDNPTGTHHPAVSDLYRAVGSYHVTTPFTCNAVIRALLNSNNIEYDLILHVT
ncbi:MAG TPA: hypothetical protein VFU19_08945 [Iamia sp.]|nr:hypothetical protein [Iamia sp.]